MIDQEEQTDGQGTKIARPYKLWIVAGAVVVAMLVGAALYFGLWRHAPRPTAKQAAKSSYGYTLTPPSHWSRVQPPPAGASVAFASPAVDTGSTGPLNAFVSVQTSTLSSAAQQLTFAQISQAYITQLAQNSVKYKQLSAATTTVEGASAMLVTYSFSEDTAPVTAETLVTVNHGVLYDVSGESLTSAWQQHNAEIQKSLLSFRP